MIPYPGESLGLIDATGSAVDSWEDVAYRPGTTLLTSGDVIVCETDIYPFYRDDPDPEAAVFSWVVEVAGGSGTLALTDGLVSAGTSLGSHAVSGTQTLVVPTASFTVADLYGVNGNGFLEVDCTSGTVTVQQVKLRFWPATGARGAWSSDTYPAWDSAPGAASGVAATDTGGEVTADISDLWGGTAGDQDEVWALAAAQLMSRADENAGTPSGTANTYTFRGQSRLELSYAFDISTGDSSYADLGAFLGLVVTRPEAYARQDPSLGLVEGVDWITPPTEVFGDVGEVLGLGAADNEWVNVGVAFDVTTDYAGAGAGNLLRIGVDGDPLQVDGSVYRVDTGASTPGGFTLPDVDQVLIIGSHLWMTAPPEIPPDDDAGADGSFSGSWLEDYVWQLGTASYNPLGQNASPLGYVQHYPTYRVWNPTAEPVTFMRVMQRGDGLGMGSGRVFNAGTRQGSSKVFGTY